MAKSLSAEQIAERRTNLRAFRKMLEMDDDADLTTTLIMQEEWLATVDELEAHIAGVIKQLQGYARDAHTLRGLRTRKCLGPTGGLALACEDCYEHLADYCAPCYMRAIHKSGGTEPDLPATSLKVDPDAFAPLPLHGVVFDDPGRLDTPFRRDKPAPRPLSVGPDYAEYRGGIPKIQERTEEECETIGQAHIWVKVGTVGLTNKSLSAMDWGDPKCLRCGIPEPEED